MAKYEKLNGASVKITNADDATAPYAISAEVQINNGKVSSVTSGYVMRGEEVMATFSQHGDGVTHTAYNSHDIEEQMANLRAINAFIHDVEALVVSHPISI
ncbi:MAG: hypothetical protein J6U45_01600 [Alistipes sp.]|nr:hypothetical protein [Alistipes sp.]